MAMSPKQQTWAIAAAMVVFIYAILAIANIAPLNNQCAWQFPKILSCLLGARENLTGGLVGGAGALFAAWVAWLAVRRQIEMEREKSAAAERAAKLRELAYLEHDLARAQKDITRLETAIAKFEPFVPRFKDLNFESPRAWADIVADLVDERQLEDRDGLNRTTSSAFDSFALKFKLLDRANLTHHDVQDIRDDVVKCLEAHKLDQQQLNAQKELAAKFKADIKALRDER